MLLKSVNIIYRTVNIIYQKSGCFDLHGCLLFLFFDAAILSFSDRTDAGSDKVGAKYFLPEALPMLSDLGSTIGFLALYFGASIS